MNKKQSFKGKLIKIHYFKLEFGVYFGNVLFKEEMTNVEENGRKLDSEIQMHL